MKAIRRSLKNNTKSTDPRASHQSKPSLHSKTATAIIPPKKVIKALYDYEPFNKNSEELAFHKGDFFHVISREDDTQWYEACNPLIPTAKGLVPVAFFVVVDKQQRQSGQSVASATGHDSGFSEKGFTAGLYERQTTANDSSSAQKAAMQSMHSRGPSTSRGGAMVYGVVLYDFHAERPDELDAKSGEPIIVVAQSNPEWFVAKPIGRLGGPGLIPVSFVQINDITTGGPVADPLAAVKAAGVPRVEEWKRTAAEYKNSSISLGQINTPQIGGAQQITQGMDGISLQHQQQPQPPAQQATQPQQPQSQQREQLLVPMKASVPRYCFDNDMYWYIIECQMSDGRWWELSRYYADFYDFQISLLEKFPEEAGNVKGKPRSLPFMPGPVAHVTDAISNGRRQNLDEYIKQIVAQPKHIREDVLVRRLFAPKPGQDYEIDPEAMEDEYRLSGHSLAQTQSRQSSGAASSHKNSSYGGIPPPGSVKSLNGGHQSRPSQNYGSGMQPALHSQASNLTKNSTGTSNSATARAGGSAVAASAKSTGIQGLQLLGGLKIKLEFESETYVLRLQENEATYQTLKEKVMARLLITDRSVPIRMRYRDDTTGTPKPLDTDKDLETAISGNANLRLVVDVR